MRSLFLCVCLFACTPLVGQDEPTTRHMNLISWQEFQEFVPHKINTVLLPVGTLEPHGVIPNGSDNLAPEAMAKELAPRLNAMVAPTLNYGITGSMSAYAGAFSISEAAYRLFLADILKGLAKNGFLNIIIINGHGGPQTAVQRAVAAEISHSHRVRTLAINWWTLASKQTFDVFGQNGGHAGNNETAYIQHIVPKHIHPERYSKEMTTPYPRDGSWAAVPFPSSIGLYEPGQGYPTFEKAKAKEYFEKVNNRVFALIKDVIHKWDLAGLYKTGK